ncbi:MAG: hypothetical protein GXP54_05005, partial [Deltaproteobacteria bacterium]|nr:hypothetical protein [Deltaproteobacteria bacterium]
LGLISDYLQNESETLRLGAVKALAVIGGKRVRTMLTDAIYNEKVLEVRVAMDKVLKDSALKDTE